MLAAAGDPLPAHGIVKRCGVAHHLFDSFPVAPAVQRILGVIVEGNVEHWTQIEIEPEKPEQTSRDVTVSPDQIDIVLIAQLLRVWRFVSDAPESRDAPTFLINCDDGLDVAQVAQIINEPSELRSALEIASENNVCPGLDAPKQTRRFGIEFLPRNTRHDQLTQRIGLHGAQR
jgi:hypothetical protein